MCPACQPTCPGLSVAALSKPWGGCGITIGWLAFQDLALKQRLVDVQYFGTASPSRASELQAISAQPRLESVTTHPPCDPATL